jgi:hypothetical protein
VLSREVAMNREEVDHGSQGKSEEVEIEKESQEGRAEKEKNRREALQPEKEGNAEKEEKSRPKESCGEKEIRAQETRAEEADGTQGADAFASTCARAGRNRPCGGGQSDHVSPVQPAGGRRQSG